MGWGWGMVLERQLHAVMASHKAVMGLVEQGVKRRRNDINLETIRGGIPPSSSH